MHLWSFEADGTWDYAQYLADGRTAFVALLAICPVLLFAVIEFFRREAARWGAVASPWSLLIWGLGYLVALTASTTAVVFAALGATSIVADIPGIGFILQGGAIALAAVLALSFWQTSVIWLRAFETALAGWMLRRTNEDESLQTPEVELREARLGSAANTAQDG